MMTPLRGHMRIAVPKMAGLLDDDVETAEEDDRFRQGKRAFATVFVAGLIV